jgi:hypothetical protein
MRIILLIAVAVLGGCCSDPLRILKKPFLGGFE